MSSDELDMWAEYFEKWLNYEDVWKAGIVAVDGGAGMHVTGARIDANNNKEQVQEVDKWKQGMSLVGRSGDWVPEVGEVT